MSKLRCPNCNSDKGYYTLNDFKNVPVHYGFDGSLKSIKLDSSQIDKRRKHAYCIECRSLISTVSEIRKKVRSSIQKHPIAINRKRLHITQQKLAEYLGCSRETIAYWEMKGVRIRNQEFIDKMDELFDNPAFLSDMETYYSDGKDVKMLAADGLQMEPVDDLTEMSRDEELFYKRQKLGVTYEALAEEFGISSSVCRKICLRMEEKQRLSNNEVYLALQAVCDDEGAAMRVFSILQRNQMTEKEQFLELTPAIMKSFRGCGEKNMEIMQAAQEYLIKSRTELFRVLVEAEEDVVTGRVAPMENTFSDLRTILKEKTK